MEASGCKMCKQQVSGLQAGVCLNCRKNSSLFDNNPQKQLHQNGKPSFGQKPNKQIKGSGSNADPNAICRHFLEGNCKFGNSCKYTHAVIFGKQGQG